MLLFLRIFYSQMSITWRKESAVINISGFINTPPISWFSHASLHRWTTASYLQKTDAQSGKRSFRLCERLRKLVEYVREEGYLRTATCFGSNSSTRLERLSIRCFIPSDRSLTLANSLLSSVKIWFEMSTSEASWRRALLSVRFVIASNS